MTEQAKTSIIKMVPKVIMGLALMAVGARFIWLWKLDVLMLIRGCLGIIIVLAGVIFLAIAKE